MRHGQSEGNVARIWTSARTGYPLTELGREQAKDAALGLRHRGVAAVYGSPLVRARQTAEEVAGVLGLQPAVLDGVEELHVGVHEGRHDDDVAPIAVEVFGRWLRHGDLDHGFEGGESGREVADRFGAALRAVVANHEGGTVVVVSHGGAMALGVAALCVNVPSQFVADHLLANCDVVDVAYDGVDWWARTWAGITLPAD